jgi:hypothetical protein
VSESSHAAKMTREPTDMMRAWTAYAVAGAVLTIAVAGIVSLLVGDAPSKAVWLSAALAYGLQLVAFALLLRFRDQANLFLAGWLGGMVLRFGALGALAFWATRFTALPPATLLLSLVGFVFVLLLLEPVFLRWDLRKS